MLQIHAKENKCIDLGRRGEDSARVIMFDISGWAELYGQGEAHLIAKRDHDLNSYPAEITQDNTTVFWVVKPVDNDQPGYGHCELVYITDGSIVKSIIYQTHTDLSLSDPLSPPDRPSVYGDLDKKIESKLNSYQGVENAGRALVVGEDGKVTTEEQLQADWDQYDSTAKDYVKNRTHYRDLQPALSGMLDVSDGGFFRIFDATPMRKAFKAWCAVKSMQTEELNRIMVVMAKLYRSPTTEDVFTSELYSKNIGNDAVMIDSTNYYYRFKNSKYHIPLYIITDLSTLTEEYAGRFDTVGLYIDVPAEHLIKSIDAGVYYYSELNERYIPSTIARTADIENLPKTNEEEIAMLIETDTLPAVKNADGKLLSMGNKIIMRH